ncbi:MAG: hypothetical protein ACLR56_10085 [Oscillospiraceae bacterium]
MMRDKDYETVLKRTLPYCKSAVAVTVENMPRSLDAGKLAATATNIARVPRRKIMTRQLKAPAYRRTMIRFSSSVHFILRAGSEKN